MNILENRFNFSNFVFTKYIIVQRSEILGPELNFVKLTYMCFFVFDIMTKECFLYARVSQTVLDQSVNRTELGFLVKFQWIYIPDSINSASFWGNVHCIPWSTSWLNLWVKHLWNIVWSKAPVWSFLVNWVDWKCEKAHLALKIENTGKNFRRRTLKIQATKMPTCNNGDMKMFNTPVKKIVMNQHLF